MTYSLGMLWPMLWKIGESGGGLSTSKHISYRYPVKLVKKNSIKVKRGSHVPPQTCQLKTLLFNVFKQLINTSNIKLLPYHYFTKSTFMLMCTPYVWKFVLATQ